MPRHPPHRRTTHALPEIDPPLSAALVAAAVGLAAALTACSNASSRGSRAAVAKGADTPVTGGKPTYAVDQEPDGKIVPWLAASWITSQDLKTYTFKLRPGVTFQDGTPFDAAAVKANLDYIAAPATKSHYAVTLLGPYTGSAVVDTSTVEIHFERPFASFLQAASTTYLGILSPKSFGQSDETLCHIVLAATEPDVGQVLLDGRPWSGVPERRRRDLRRAIQAVHQDPLSSFDPRYTVEQIVGEALDTRPSLTRPARRERIAALLDAVGLVPDLLSRRPLQLSGGQRQRVAIARALAGRTPLCP